MSAAGAGVEGRHPAAPPEHDGMVWLPGGNFLMGSEDFYPEESPIRRAAVEGLWIDEHPVTVAQFRRFVEARDYLTWAEKAPDANDYPEALPELLVPGSLVFTGADGPVDLVDIRNWWSWVPGAQWRYPEGSGSTLHGRELHPVTHVAYEDASAYAAWAGKELPSEAEWEYAARGGLEGATFIWGNEFAPEGRMMANTWQGDFPWENTLLDGYKLTSPVKDFPANEYGLFDMAGNVWEWTNDLFATRTGPAASCCAPQNRQMEAPSGAREERFPRHVIKGGSHLCAPNYCLRYRPAARQGEPLDTTTSHIGFRCIKRGY